MRTFLIILSHFSRGMTQRVNCDNNRQLSTASKNARKGNGRCIFTFYEVPTRHGDKNNRKPLHNVQSSGIGNKESRPIINSPWNRMIIYYFPSIIAAALLELLIIGDRRFYDISLPFAGMFFTGITHTNRTRVDAFERKLKIDRSSYCGISFPDGNYRIPSFVTFYSHGNFYRNNEFYVICRGILLTSKLRIIAERGLNGVSRTIIDCRAKSFIGLWHVTYLE